METTIEATPITGATGKGNARKLRANGAVPAVVYGSGSEARRVSVNPKALLDLFDSTKNRNTVVQLHVDGQIVPCLVRDVQRHPVSRQLLHVDFYVLSEGVVEVTVPVRALGKPKGTVAGGKLLVITRELRARCAHGKIPATFDIDTSDMDIGDVIKASQVPTAEGVEVLYDHDFKVLELEGKRAEA